MPVPPAVLARPVGASPDHRPSRIASRAVPLLAAATIAVRLPLVGRPATPDEGGLLLLAGQWAPGRSLYGAYWVDRPPLLVGFFAVADRLGGLVALHLLGLGLVAVSVLLAGRLGRLVVGADRAVGAAGATRAPVAAAAIAAVLLCQPRFGAYQVDGELVAVPLVLAGLTLLFAAVRSPTALGVAWRVAGAGACAAAACGVKQNEIDVAVVLLLAGPRLLRRTPLGAPRALLAAGAGAVAAVVLTLGLAVERGTRLPALWEAVVVFRWRASGLIAAQATAATSDRLHQLLLASVLAGVPLLVLRWVAALPDGPVPGALDLRLGTAVLLAWETVSVLAGGSYWLHYLLCLVPGLVLAEAQLGGSRRRGTRPRPPVVPVLLALACAWPLATGYADAARGSAPDPTVAWLRAHRLPGDTAVIAFGRADLLYDTGLRSPYPELWSLPVRVRDPDLARLARVLWSPRRPVWIVTGPGGSLSGWGIDAAAAEVPFRTRYREVADLGATRVFRVRGVPRPLLTGALPA